MNDEWSILQNGNDIRGVADDGIIGETVTLSTAKVEALGKGFVRWLWRHEGHRHLSIAVGMDCRLTGPMFIHSLEQAITHLGSDVLNCGVTSTPAMLMSTSMPDVNADGAIMITGSHMTFNYNGLKFFHNGADISKEELAEIIEIASVEVDDNSQVYGDVHICNLQAKYARVLRNKILEELSDAPNPQLPLEGLKIVVDAGNGAGGFFATRVLKHLGADITGSQFLVPDGRFPNHMPNPEDYEAMCSLEEAVKNSNADLGIIFDSDVDRVAIVDNEGRNYNRNEFVALASAIVLEQHPNTKIVTDSITSNGLDRFIVSILGGRHCRYQRGYRNVIAEAKRLNENGEACWLAVETSGHAAFRENNFYDDGAYFAIKVVIKLAKLKRAGKTLYSLIEKLPVPAETMECRLRVKADDFGRVADDTMAGLRQFVSQVRGWEEVNKNHEGLRVLCPNDKEQGWFLIRRSLHEAVLPLNIESEVAGGAQEIANKLKLYFRNIRNIDSTSLYK
ncbi:MAG: phosphomannomutase/phosphoglucomutase [Bacteroidales bacterium]|nr:phosphomannomutase/phosphoglucomutase [Bacteroidales bacterium]